MVDQEQLDQVVDEVAGITQRNVSLDDVSGRVLAYNTSHPTTDRARIDSVMMKMVSVDAQSWAVAGGLSARMRPFILPANPELRLLARVCIPLICKGFRVGYLWILVRDDADPPEPILNAAIGLSKRMEEFSYLVMEAIEPATQERIISERTLMTALRGSDQALPSSRGLQEMVNENPLRVAVITSPVLYAPHVRSGPNQLRLVRQATADAVRMLQGRFVSAAAVDHAVLIISHAIGDSDLLRIAHRFEQFLILHDVDQIATEESPGPARYGVSTAATDTLELSDKYLEALVTVQARCVDERLSEVTSYDAIGIYQFLSQAGRAWRSRSSMLTALERASNGEALLSILELIYDSDCSRHDLAAQLHIHRTSLYNRLQQIGTIIGADPLSSAVRLDLHVGLKARRWSQRPKFNGPDD